jgi:hypothetical protein
MIGPSADRQQSGKALRQAVPRTSHGDWTAREAGGDVVTMLERSNAGRLPELAPIRFGRMLQNPFAFLRGAPAVMACDLAGTPLTGLTVQACGDCHLVNFGLFASPERKLVFDINDFDETLRGPWEWDVKRLAASFVVAARVNGFSEERAAALAVRSAASYRRHMHEFAEMSPVEVWYFHIDADDLVASAPDEESRRLSERMASKARQRVGERLFPKITEPMGHGRQFMESPPLTTRVVDERALRIVRHGIERYLLLRGAAGVRRPHSPPAPDQRGAAVGVGPVCRAVAVCQPRAARRGWAAHDPGHQRYFPRMAAGPRRARLLRAAAPRHEILGGD